ncbi:hypothetical protein [uncultured Albimonas sp.]|uniref:hypothetical protein n=1 Tax=uncultured Albimonas sp. TaxID=1331701 RepID=UPI0030ECBCA2
MSRRTLSALLGLALLGACAEPAPTPPAASASAPAGPAEEACLAHRVALGGPGGAAVTVEGVAPAGGSREVVLRDAEGQGFRCLASSAGEVEDFAAILPGSRPSTGAATPEAACLEAVADVSGEARATTLSSEFSEAGTLVRVAVGDPPAPWRCIAYRDGSTAGIEAEPADDHLSGAAAEFDAMAGPCRDQAARMTGLPPSAVEVSNRIRTGGGPLLTLLAGETALSCRQEPGGRVAVFSEFAN